MNRTEYANAIRDLLHLDIDTTTLLPADDSSEGFDNLADALRVSPALVERYTSAAVKVSRLAVGNLLLTASTATYRVPGDLTQSNHLDGLPLGTRGGTLIEHTFPLDAEYSFRIRVRGAAIGLAAANLQGEEIEVSARRRAYQAGPGDGDDRREAANEGWPSRALASPSSGNRRRVRMMCGKSLRPTPACRAWQSPDRSHRPALGDTPSRRRIFVCHPQSQPTRRPPPPRLRRVSPKLVRATRAKADARSASSRRSRAARSVSR